MPTTTPSTPAPAPATPEPAATPAKVSKAAPKMTPEQKLDAILAYMEKQDHRARRHAVWMGFRQLLSLLYLGIFLYGGWYLYQNQDKLMDTLLKKSTEYALQATKGKQTATGGTVQIQLDDTFIKKLSDRIIQQTQERQPKVQITSSASSALSAASAHSSSAQSAASRKPPQ